MKIMENYVSKFGGSSVQNFDVIKRIVADDARRKYIVLSAPGDSDRSKRITQQLIGLAQQRLNGQSIDQCQDAIDSVVAKYENSFKINSPQTGDRLTERLNQTISDPEGYMAAVKAFGEEEAARLAAPLLDATFVDAKEFMLVTGPFDHATVQPKAYNRMKRVLLSHSKDNQRYTLPGFYGIRNDGLIATFSFGGSDQTGAEVARGINADCYENFTDSPIRAADPRIISDAKIIAEMTRNELRDLSYGGFSIFHPQAVKPLHDTSIPLHVRSTKDYPHKGTMVLEERISDPKKPIIGIAYQHGFCAFSVSKIGLNDEIGILARTANVFYNPKIKRNIPIEFPASGIDDLSFVARQNVFNDGNYLSKIKTELYEASGSNGSKVKFRENLSCLVVAGKGLVSNEYVSAYAQIALADAGVRIIASSKGAERRCLLFAVPQDHAEKAVKGLYERFIA